MTARLAITAEEAGRPLDWSMLVPIADASRLMGKSLGHMRRIAPTLVDDDLAIFAAPPTGGQPQWHIDRRYNTARLMRDRAVDDVDAAAIERYTAKQRRLAFLRAECVIELRNLRAEPGRKIADELPSLIGRLKGKHKELRGISRTSLYRWDALYQTAADVEKLIDDRGGSQAKGDAAAWAWFESQYCSGNKPSLKTVWERTLARATAEGWQWCKMRTCRSQLEERIAPAKQAFHRDPAKYRSMYAPKIKQHPDRFAAGRCWVGDHTQLDFWCWVGDKLVRPFLTTWMDWRTRRIVGWCLAPVPNSGTIMAALKMGMLDPANMGGPGEVVVDNGKDYDAFMWDGQTKMERRDPVRVLKRGYVDEGVFGGVFGMLQVETHYSIAYCPDGKAPQERWYGTLHGNFCKSMPTYCGRNPQEKPEGLEDVLKDRRNVPAFRHVLERIPNYIAGYNASADHRMENLIDPEAGNERLSPDQAMSRWCTTRRMFGPGVLELALRCWHQPVGVGAYGVTIRVGGMPLTYGSTDMDLMRLKGRRQKVYVSYDMHDLSEVHVYDSKLRRITTAQANDLGGQPGVGREHVSRLMKAKRAVNKAIATLQERPELQYLTNFELLGIEAAQDTKQHLVQEQGALKLIQTPLDEQADPRHPPLRKAAGAEGVGDARSLPSLDRLASFRLPDAELTEDDGDALISPATMGAAEEPGGEREDQDGPLSPWSRFSGDQQ